MIGDGPRRVLQREVSFRQKAGCRWAIAGVFPPMREPGDDQAQGRQTGHQRMLMATPDIDLIAAMGNAGKSVHQRQESWTRP